jgi:hypothetical protein
MAFEIFGCRLGKLSALGCPLTFYTDGNDGLGKAFEAT